MNRNEGSETKYLAYCPLCSGIPLFKSNCSFLRTHNAGYKWVRGLHPIIRIDAMFGGNKVLFIKSHFHFFYSSEICGGVVVGSWRNRITLLWRTGATSSYPFFNLKICCIQVWRGGWVKLVKEIKSTLVIMSTE